MSDFFENIVIDGGANDINITEGKTFSAEGGDISIRDNTLTITPRDDIEIALPPGDYCSFKVTTTSGDLNIDLSNCHVQHISYSSNSGDADVNVNADNVDLRSSVGICNFNKIGANRNKNTVNTRSCTRKLKTSFSRVNNERYE